MDENLPQNITCPVCGNAIERGTEKKCELCATPHHQECWDYNFGCATFGCREVYHRRGMCTMCGQSTKEIAFPEVPIEIVPFAQGKRRQLAPQLCKQCAEEHILTGGQLPSRAFSTMIFACSATLGLIYGITAQSLELLLISGVVAVIAAIWGYGMLKEMARNAQELPEPPRLGQSNEGKGKE